jgi:CMP-N,N'-diacetyllegionaminic acid synthase
MKFLILIPARGGSKGVPKKNIKELIEKPLIFYSIDVARGVTDDSNICVSTDDTEIIDTIENGRKLKVPFVRPSELATDTATSYDVMLHAINHYENIGIIYDAIILLQPTSPLRLIKHLKEAISLYNSSNVEMVVSVVESKGNPYFNLFEENSSGLLEKSKKANYTRRQDCPKVYEYNGSIYIIDIKSLKKGPVSMFTKIKKYEMEPEYSIDIDTPFDWKIAELLMIENLSNSNEN